MTLLEGSQIFFNIAAGLAALVGLAIYSGRAKKLAFSIKYPADNIGKTLKLVQTTKTGGRVYLVDTKTKTKRWIMSSGTFNDLGYDWSKIETMDTEEFESYKTKPPMHTSGIPGL